MSEPHTHADHVRPPAVAGTWYPNEAIQLTADVERMLAEAEAPHREWQPCALIVPHAGLRYSGPTAAHAYVALAHDAFDRVVVLAPSHREPLRGAAVDPSTLYETPLGQMRVDRSAVETLAGRLHFSCNARPFAHEHAIEMQLPFLQVQLPRASLVPVLVGEMNAHAVALVAEALQLLLNERTLFVVSSDFMHYGAAFGYVPFRDRVPENIWEFDALAIAAIQHKSPEEFQAVLESTQSTICGRNPLRVFLRMLPRDWSAELLAYTTSGALTGDFSHSVSYASIAFCSGAPASGAPAPAP